MVSHIGPLATRSCEPRQARKGAAAAVASCAGCGWYGAPPILRWSPYRACTGCKPDEIIGYSTITKLITSE